MDTWFVTTLCLALVLGSALATRECYVCSEASDEQSGKNCDEKNPDTSEIARVSVPDDNKECLYCFKSIPDDGDVSRGCVSKDEFNDNIKDTYSFGSKKDGCKKDDNDNEYCICEGNKCNGGGHVVISALSFGAVLMGAMLVF